MEDIQNMFMYVVSMAGPGGVASHAKGRNEEQLETNVPEDLVCRLPF